MTETLFYHLDRRGLDEALPPLVEKTRERGWRALIRADSADRAAAIDTRLWTYKDESFLAHALDGEGEAARQPVLITVEEDMANTPDVLFLVGGAVPPSWDDASAGQTHAHRFDVRRQRPHHARRRARRLEGCEGRRSRRDLLERKSQRQLREAGLGGAALAFAPAA